MSTHLCTIGPTSFEYETIEFQFQGDKVMKKSELRQIIKEEIQSLLSESTNSSIGLLNKNGSVSSIYVHWDGSLDSVGKMLKTHYKDPTKIAKLIKLGNVSSLEPKLDPKGTHTFKDPEKGVTVFYGRDRGESSQGSKTSRDAEDYVSKLGQQYTYLYDPDEKAWTYSKGGPTFNKF